ncbi:hypothetical protein PAHAL_6G279600 [Panicum hallii]|uniref:Uncharacterized protein n=1 Tax=Panicum hallii TaxID=206008 RepID=A0A2S3I487_9POAL|nr:uncharacterized protein LOC112897304 [Panicum hallii]PAN36409.1 hypothetical protein PAHAL_6G279600 [Panicum hallii]
MQVLPKKFAGSSAKMASRRLFQRSTSLLGGAHASAARAAAAPPARYFNIFPCSHADAKTSLTTIGMPSTIMNGMKPAFLDFAGGVKRTFSSSAPKSNNHKFARETEKAARYETAKRDADTIVLMSFCFFNFFYLYTLDNARSNNSSSRCLNCCNCPCQGSNPKVQQD